MNETKSFRRQLKHSCAKVLPKVVCQLYVLEGVAEMVTRPPTAVNPRETGFFMYIYNVSQRKMNIPTPR